MLKWLSQLIEDWLRHQCEQEQPERPGADPTPFTISQTHGVEGDARELLNGNRRAGGVKI